MSPTMIIAQIGLQWAAIGILCAKDGGYVAGIACGITCVAMLIRAAVLHRQAKNS